MTTNEARKQNLVFTGSWVSEWDSEGRAKQKQEASNLRKQGCRAVLVQYDHGYSIYADEKHSALELLETCKSMLSRIESRRQAAFETYSAELVKISEKETYCNAKITEICNKYNIQ